MATTYGNNKRKSVASVTNPTEMVNVAESGGRMRVMYDTYEAEGGSPTDANNTGANGTIVVIGTLPKGARIWNIILQADALGSSVTLSAGYAAHTNSSTGASVSVDLVAFIAATAMNTAKKVLSMSWGYNEAASDSIDNLGFECVDDAGTDIIVDIDGAAATGTIKSVIFYTLD
tara:strand:- start:4 stop:525 length:522 start_codon:yes stop_codon:yes gene_type:complete